ncbi:MAG: transporter substrate-binding domain-containing protein [Candidatus Latescibacteria bacterium]|nr:transporter substrate-binding domain-containing protein [Candidatus Latescibacterota bacterium]NIM64419.1 transporter substrate-binding domain-containing protein [Candidatus Latescibacterota bacterium]NIO00573.1 transporter substrate-binding domain-containing protein [Candidatus Latescibacterota bacterium]NIO26973.1 transporter substrate-binding domain-containing protein [Candidatus Latescibacterota bacterium]NIO56050.1 transporter substrate-binding domain-containing protein [Candidatus Late
MDSLLERRYIRVLTVFNKTGFFTEKGRFFGFEYELLEDYEQYLNKRIGRSGLNVVLEFIPCQRDQLIEKLLDGYGDIVAAQMTSIPERKKLVDFTRPYLTGIKEVLITNEWTAAPRSIEELAGKEVFVRKNSSYYHSLLSLNERFAREGKELVRILESSGDLETEDILEMVSSGAVSMTVCDSYIAGIWKRLLNHIAVHENIVLRSNVNIAWMVRKNNPKLKASCNKFLKTRRRGTLLGNIYFNRYYRETSWITNPLDEKDRRKAMQYEELFKKYAERYGFDWRLIMALAYQESRLDHGKKSQAGAIGLMQIRQETSTDENVNIEDVYKLDNNIHAGVRYPAFLRDHYFDSPEIRPRDRIRFALASYNAGPTAIARARMHAREIGLDPDRWFRNVELAALHRIGREPTRYVSNINKYYVIYRIAY